MTTILLAGVIIFAAHVVAGVTGFGSNVLGLPLLALVVGLDAGKQSLIVLSTLMYVYLIVRWHEHVDVRELVLMLALAAIGVPLGMMFYGALPKGASMILLGVFVAAVGVKGLLDLAPERAAPAWLAKLLLVVGGFVHGAFTTGGPVLIVYANRAIPDKSVFRATLSVLWILLNIPLMATWSVRHTWSPTTARVILLGLPFLIGGLALGEWLHQRVNPRVFRIAVDACLCGIGILLIATAMAN